MIKARQRQRARRGFSLVETMVAVVLLGFATIVFGTALPAASQAMSKGRNSDLATDACQQRLEFYRNVGYNSLPTIPTGASQTSVTFTPPSAMGPATGTVTFTRVDDGFNASTTDTGRVRVEARIVWNGGSGARGGTVTVTTLILR
jgi:prepilin-type N-terminal cleavage/methylation domain-containing protein